MFCPKCGKQLPEEAKFCGGCGYPIQIKPAKAMQGQAGSVTYAKLPPDTAIPQNMALPSNVRDTERKNKKLTVVLSIVLLMLVLVAACIGGYYFKVVKGELNNLTSAQTVESDNEAGKEAEMETGMGENDAVDPVETNQAEAVEEMEETTGVVSDTNEVVADTILENIPKSVYSYQFNGDLGGAQLVTRSDIDVEPEAVDEREPEYVHGVEGQAVYLDGTYGIKLSDVEDVGDSYTIAFWMKADLLCDWSPFIHIGYDLEDPGKRVRLWLGQKTDGDSVAPIISSERAEVEDSFEIRPDQSMPNTVEPGIWYHIAFTVDASRQGSRAGSVLGTLYVAGQYIGSGDVVLNTLNTDRSEVYLGINRWDQLYPVAFDEVKIWNEVLEAEQIRDLYDVYK